MSLVEPRKILVVMSDLFFSVKINDAAKKLGRGVEFVKDEAVAREKIKAGPALAIFDLNCASVDPIELIRLMKSDPATARIRTIGFVSHVQTEIRQKAVESGCDAVVARSAFAQNLTAMLESYLAQEV
jgi:CheY-like chemotaxis protein